MHELAAISGVILTSCSQLLLKAGARNSQNTRLAMMKWQTLLGYFFFFAVTLLNVFALQEMALSRLVAWYSFTFVLVAAGSAVFLREHVPLQSTIGCICISGGIIAFV